MEGARMLNVVGALEEGTGKRAASERRKRERERERERRKKSEGGRREARQVLIGDYGYVKSESSV